MIVWMLMQRTQADMPLGVNREHAAESTVGCTKSLPVRNDKARCIILLIEVSPVNDKCRIMLFLCPPADEQRLRRLIGYTQMDMMWIKSHDCYSILIIARTFPILITRLHSRSSLVPHVQ